MHPALRHEAERPDTERERMGNLNTIRLAELVGAKNGRKKYFSTVKARIHSAPLIGVLTSSTVYEQTTRQISKEFFG